MELCCASKRAPIHLGTATVPTRVNLGRRLSMETTLCPMCKEVVETNVYLLVECSFVNEAWEEAKLVWIDLGMAIGWV